MHPPIEFSNPPLIIENGAHIVEYIEFPDPPPITEKTELQVQSLFSTPPAINDPQEIYALIVLQQPPDILEYEL
jgi:hypothetical protein